MKKKKKSGWTRKGLIRHLERVLSRLYEPFRDSEDIGSGEWLSMLFQFEALRGCIQSLRVHRSLERAIYMGKVEASRSIWAWTRKKKHFARARKTEILIGLFLENKIDRFKKRHKRKA